MRLKCAIRKKKTNFYNVTLPIFHTLFAITCDMLFLEPLKNASLSSRCCLASSLLSCIGSVIWVNKPVLSNRASLRRAKALFSLYERVILHISIIVLSILSTHRKVTTFQRDKQEKGLKSAKLQLFKPFLMKCLLKKSKDNAIHLVCLSMIWQFGQILQ